MALAAAGLCGLSIAQPHRIRLGFNVGYLSDGVKYQKARSTLRADGLLLHHRYMGAWMHPNGSASTRTSNWTASLLSEYLDELGVGASATITLSDFPFNVQPDFIVNASLFLDAWAGRRGTSPIRFATQTEHRQLAGHGFSRRMRRPPRRRWRRMATRLHRSASYSR